MAKHNGLSKSQAIRDYYKTHPKARAQEVVDALSKQGMKTTTNYVGNIKTTHNKRHRARRKVVAEGGVGIPEVKAALAFLKLTGSAAAAKKAITVAEQIKKIV